MACRGVTSNRPSTKSSPAIQASSGTTAPLYIAREIGQIEQFLGVVAGLVGLSVIIAVLGIANTLLLGVLERTREIGLLRAVGMSRRQVRTMVQAEGAILAARRAGRHRPRLAAGLRVRADLAGSRLRHVCRARATPRARRRRLRGDGHPRGDDPGSPRRSHGRPGGDRRRLRSDGSSALTCRHLAGCPGLGRVVVR